MQPKVRPLSPIILDDGTYQFFPYPESLGYLRLIKAKTALEALKKLLMNYEIETNFGSLILSFSSKYGLPTHVVDAFDHANADLEEVAIGLLNHLYDEKKIDPHKYYRWQFMSNGLMPFLFRGADEAEIMQSLMLNYRKALSCNANRHATPKQLKYELDMAFRTLFGMKGLNIGELLSYRFVSQVHIRDLKTSGYCINKYKRAA